MCSRTVFKCDRDMKGGTGSQFAFFSAASGIALVVAETAYIYDKSWATYRSCLSFIVLEYVSFAFTLCGVNILTSNPLRCVWRQIELVAALLGVFASSKTGYALSVCALDAGTLSERGAARECLDVYDSYASLDGPFGTDTVCASLNKNIESPLGGTCPTISYSDEAVGKAVLGAQFGVIVALTVLHFYKYMTLHAPDTRESSLLGVSSVSIPPSRPGRSIFDLGTAHKPDRSLCETPQPPFGTLRGGVAVLPSKRTPYSAPASLTKTPMVSVYCSNSKTR